MRKISLLQIGVFLVLFIAIIGLGFGTTALFFGHLELGDFRGVLLIILGIFVTYVYAVLVFRVFLRIAPLREGVIGQASKEEFVYHVYLLFFLLIFYPVMRSGAVPLPLMRLLYLGLGAKLGDNTYSSGIILDPIFVEAGSNTLIGQYALIIPHVIENDKLEHYRVRIGNNVTIGAHAVVLAGVTIGDDAMVATGSVVKKGTTIAAGEVWGGVPAKCLKGGRSEAEG
ncbi:MAG: acyltransferase [Chromatiaceae bacterium]|nr:acyltransferase [Gammaproteobacteria bacterium]MCB1878601.1 acyltransferase [Gammaproteobacteria bacterium]MCP5448645.1 acyltransferase [Chromatiaceae bacterium]